MRQVLPIKIGAVNAGQTETVHVAVLAGTLQAAVQAGDVMPGINVRVAIGFTARRLKEDLGIGGILWARIVQRNLTIIGLENGVGE